MEIPSPPTIAHIASATLPAAGAYYTSATPYQFWKTRMNGGVRRLTVLTTYTRGGAAGGATVRPVWYFNSPTAQQNVALSAELSTYSASATATAGGTALTVQDTASAVTEATVFTVPAGAVAVKIDCKESGNTAAPGALAVYLLIGD
jgi:hypothetical protein